MGENAPDSRKQVTAWPFVITVTIGLFVFKNVEGSPVAGWSYWFVFAPVLITVLAGAAALLVWGLVAAWAARSEVKSLEAVAKAVDAGGDALLDRLEALSDEELSALMETVGIAYVGRIALKQIETLAESEVA